MEDTASRFIGGRGKDRDENGGENKVYARRVSLCVLVGGLVGLIDDLGLGNSLADRRHRSILWELGTGGLKGDGDVYYCQS